MRFDPPDRRPSPFGGLPPAGPVTRAVVGALLVVSLGGALLDRRAGLGASWLVFDRDAVLAGELWRLFTYPFVKVDSPLGLLLGAAAFYLFGASFERRWGSRAFGRFAALTAVGAAVLAVPLGRVLGATGLFVDRGVYGGPDAVIDALLVALALEAPDAPILFGFLLPVPARTFVLALLGLEVIGGILTGVASLGLTLGGMAMGLVLLRGLWRPSVFVAEVRRLWGRRQRRRRGLYVVPPRTGSRGRPDRWVN